MNYKPLGNFIQIVDNRNKNLENIPLVGLSVQKKFIPSIANTIGSDMSKYKIIEKRQFAYGTVTSRNNDKITIALFDDYEKALISQVYISFEVKDTTKLNPEYLMMWFRRPEFDRYARFKSHGSAREIFGWEEMCDSRLPVPSIATQQAIVDEYRAIQQRIALNETICKKLEDTAQTLYRKYFVDDIDKDNLPEGWRWGTIDEYAKVKSGFAFKSNWWQKNGIPIIKIGSIQNNTIQISENDYVDNNFLKIAKDFKAVFGDIVIAMTGATIGKIAIIPSLGSYYLVNQRVGLFNLGEEPIKKAPFLYFLLQQDDVQNEILSVGGSSAQENISASDIENIKIRLPSIDTIELFNNKCCAIFQAISKSQNENQKLKELLSLLLAKMGKDKEML